MQFRTSSLSRPALLLLIGVPLLLAPRGCDEPGDPGECFCPQNYAPVCGVDGQNYSNACHADCAGVDVAHEGTCEPVCACPAIYAPICGTDGNTYGNECEAACAGVMAAYEGECGTSCACPEIYAPVCGDDHRTYGNGCEAACAGVTVVAEGPCECPAIPPIYCEWGYAVDENGCPTPECLPPPECPTVLCDVYCEFGHARDERGCDTCACCPPVPPIACEFGYVVDASGCTTGECLPPPPERELCFGDDECGEGRYCDHSECLSGCEGAPEDAVCPAVCYGQCRDGSAPPPPVSCRSDADCAAGEICATAACLWDDPSAPCPSEGICVAQPEPPPPCEG